MGFSNSTHTRWELKDGTWQRVNGHTQPGKDFKAETLIILYARVGDAGYTDPAGNPVPETVFEGTGDAVILNGKNVTEGSWNKGTLEEQITLKDKDGQPIGINPGHIWIELVPQSGGSANLS